MIRIENHLGTIEISQEYFAYLIGNAASSCYGVAGMVKSGTQTGHPFRLYQTLLCRRRDPGTQRRR